MTWNYNLSDFVSGCLYPFGRVVSVIVVLCWMYQLILPNSNVFVVIIVTLLISILSIVLLGLTAKERQQARNMLDSIKQKIFR